MGMTEEIIWEYTDKNGVKWSALPLIYHVALYQNLKITGGFREYENRFCIASLAMTKKAVLEQEKTGEELKYWQKWHNKAISISGCYAYRDGVLHSPEYALKKVGWDADEISREAELDWKQPR